MVQYPKTFEYIQNLVMNDELQIDIKHDINMFKLLKKKHPKAIKWFANQLDYNFGSDIPESIEFESYGHTCSTCGQYIEQYVFKNNTISELHPIECYTPQPYSVDIPIPSGKMFFTNSIEDLEMDFENVGYYMAKEYTALGHYQRSIEYSKFNIACFFIGNSMPTLYQNGTTIVLGQEYDNGETTMLPLENSVDIGHLDTTVWQVMVTDYSNLIKEQLTRGFSIQDEYYFVVPVKPGIYRFTNYYPIIDTKNYKLEADMYVKIERIADA